MSKKVNVNVAMRFLIGIVLPTLALHTHVSSAESFQTRFQTAKISIGQWQTLLAEVEATPDVKCDRDLTYQYICDIASQRTIWVFTTVGHPAHPAVSRGILFQSRGPGGAILNIDRSGHYAGDRAEFEKWIRQLVILDQKRIADLVR